VEMIIIYLKIGCGMAKGKGSDGMTKERRRFACRGLPRLVKGTQLECNEGLERNGSPE